MNVDFERFISPGDVVLVAVSGGADSMCLLHLLICEQRKRDFGLVCVHVNHQIRGSESDRDEEVVREFCKAQNVMFECVRVNAVAKAQSCKLSLEEAARLLRYEALGKLKKKHKATKIFVAHNQNDQAETVLMHILRGSGMAGAGGMAVEKNGIVRPLLGVSRAEIEAHDREHGVPFVVDSTNLDSAYSRNNLRLCVMPQLEAVYGKAVESLASFGQLAASDEEFISSLLPLEKLEGGSGIVVIDGSAASLHKALLSRLILAALNKLGAEKDIFRVHIEKVMHLFSLPCGKRVSLPNALEASRVARGVKIRKICPKTLQKSQKFGLKNYNFENISFSVCPCEVPKTFKKGELYFDADKVPADAIFRTRRSGDTFKKLGASGKKSYADYLTDMKVDSDLRDQLIVLSSGSQVLLTVGLDISDDIKIEKSTKNAAVIKTNLTKRG